MKDYRYEATEQVSKPNRTARTIIIIMAVVFAVSLIWGIWQNIQKRYYGALLESQYQRSFYTMVGGTEQISLASGKILASGGRQSNGMFHEMKNQAELVTNSLSNLPIDQNSIIRTSQYFNQIGDYFGSLAKTISDGEKLSEEDILKLQEINQNMQSLNEIIVRMQEKAASGDMHFTVAKSLLTNGIIPVAGDKDNIPNANSPMTYLNEVNDSLSALTAMEYNGAYSSHLWELEPKGLTAGEDIGKEKAEAIAREFATLMTDQNLSLDYDRDIGGQTTFPAYEFNYKYGNESITVVVSKSGGKVINAFNLRSSGKASISNEEAIKKAEATIKEAGYETMELIQQKKDERNNLILKYARSHEDVLYYPDSIQISIALDNGEVIAFQAKDYWMNYDEGREFPELLMDVESVSQGIAKGMDIGESRLALIADGAGNELLCHEFNCKIGDDEYMVYMNAEAGVEEQILRRYSGEDGFYTR